MLIRPLFIDVADGLILKTSVKLVIRVLKIVCIFGLLVSLCELLETTSHHRKSPYLQLEAHICLGPQQGFDIIGR